MKKKTKRNYYKDDALLRQIGENIRAVRLANEISIEKLANEYGIDYSQLNRMELGKVNFSISYLYKIAEMLNVSPKDLLP